MGKKRIIAIDTEQAIDLLYEALKSEKYIRDTTAADTAESRCCR